MIHIKRYSKFLLDKETEKADAKLRYRIKWSDYIVAFNVGYRVSIDKWSPETQRCKNGTTHAKGKVSASDINKAIQNIEDSINNIFYDFETIDKIPTADELRKAYNISIGKEKGASEINTISFVCGRFIAKAGRERSWSESTYKKVRTVRDHMISCFGDIPLNNITENELSRLLIHLQKNSLKRDCPGLRNTTIIKDIKIAKWILRWAHKNDYYNGNAFLTFSPKLRGATGKINEVIFLTWEELIRLYNLEITNNSLSHVRDVFCFCCFTGLRYSDVANLKRVNVHDNFISVVTEKTDDPIKIELNKYSKTLLERYKNIPLPNDLALPVISNQRMNQYLKEVAVLAELNSPVNILYYKGSKRIETVYKKHELITTHCGRRTFIVNSLYLGIPAEVIMKWTGHSDYDAMKPYIEIVDKLKEAEMNKFNLK